MGSESFPRVPVEHVADQILCAVGYAGPGLRFEVQRPLQDLPEDPRLGFCKRKQQWRSITKELGVFLASAKK